MNDTTNSGHGDPGHNIQARKAVIHKGFEELYRLDADIADAIEQHVKPLKDARTKKNRDLKADLDIPSKVIKLQYKQFAMARQAAEDPDDEATLDEMRELFEALHPGGQLDWIKAINQDNSALAAVKAA